MNRINKIIICLLTIFLIIAAINIVKAENTSFVGSRDITIEIDESDINSYISGGREAFEYVIRKYKPDWLVYDLKTQNKTVTFTMNFDFSTYDEYVERLTEVLGYKPAIIYENSQKTSLVEGFKAIELTNFIKNGLETENMLFEGNIQNFFIVKSSNLQLQDSKYETLEAIDTREKQDVVLFSRVNIETVIENISSISRKITVIVDSEDDDAISQVKERLQKVGELEEVADTHFIVTFTSNSLEDLSKKTMQILNVSVAINEKEEYSTDEKVKVTYEEIIDTEKLLTENGYFNSKITCPKVYENIQKEEDSAVTINGNVVSLTKREENLIFTYERPVTFKNIKIVTDLTNVFGEIDRKIILQIPTESAIYYKDILQDKISKILTRGMTLNIYDEGIMRCYSIDFKALTFDRIQEKTAQIISGKDSIKFDNKQIFFLKSNIREKIEVNTIIEGILQTTNVEMEYILPKSTNKIKDEKVNEKIYSQTLVFESNIEDEANYKADKVLEFTFTYNNYLIMAVILIIIIILIILILIIKSKIKKKIKAKSEKTSKNQ